MKKLLTALFLVSVMLLSLSGCGNNTLLNPRKPVELTFWHVYGE